MKRFQFLRLAACLALALFAFASSFGEEPKPVAKKEPASSPSDKKPLLRIASDASFPPMEYTDDNGDVVGFDVDLVKAVATEAGYDPRVLNTAWAGIFGALENKNVDVVVSSVTITEERQKNYQFTDPYYDAAQSLVVRSGEKDKLTSLDALKGKKVGAQIGTTGFERLKQETTFKEVLTYDSAPLAFADLVNGAIDGVMIDKPVAQYYANRKPQLANKLAVLPEDFTKEQFGFVLRKDDKELCDKLNAALKKLRENGEYDRIHSKWFGEGK